MGYRKRARSPRKIVISVITAISLMVILTAAVSASSQSAKWSGVGQVLFAGPSQDPAAQTTTVSEFKLKRDGSIKSVKINTSNELVVGVLGDATGSAITKCKDRKHSSACENLEAMITGARVTSFHNSQATLRGISQWMQPVPGIGDVPVLGGNLRGKLEGIFTLDNATGVAVGTASLRIRKGSTAVYACFGLSPVGPIPLTTLQPCIDNSGGQLFPIVLDVHDKGKFVIGQGHGSMSDILGLEGKVEVNAQANLLTEQFGGTIIIPKAKASLVGEDKPGRGDDDDEDEDEDDD